MTSDCLVYYMTRSMWTPDYHTYMSLFDISKLWSIWNWASFCSYNSPYSPGKALHKILEYVSRICAHWAKRTFVRLGSSGSQSAFQFIPTVFAVVEVRILCRRPCLYGPSFVHNHAWKERIFPKLLLQCCLNVIVGCFITIALYCPNPKTQPYTTISSLPKFIVSTMHSIR